MRLDLLNVICALFLTWKFNIWETPGRPGALRSPGAGGHARVYPYPRLSALAKRWWLAYPWCCALTFPVETQNDGSVAGIVDPRRIHIRLEVPLPRASWKQEGLTSPLRIRPATYIYWMLLTIKDTTIFCLLATFLLWAELGDFVYNKATLENCLATAWNARYHIPRSPWRQRGHLKPTRMQTENICD